MQKRILLAVVLAFIWAGIGALPVLAEPFAPKADIPAGLSKGGSLDALMAKNSIVPDRSEVGVPAYPGAKVLFAQPSSDMTVNDKAMKSMARVVLGTTDAIPEVVAFYKTELSGWQTGNFYGTDYFWKSGEFKPLSEAAMTTPNLFVREQFQSAPNEVMPEAKAIIEIYYYPPQ